MADREPRASLVYRINNGNPGLGALGHEEIDLNAFDGPQVNGRAPHGINSVRNHLFHVMLVRLTLGYASHTTQRTRRFVEFGFLAFAICCLFGFVYIRMLTPDIPSNCLQHVKHTWPKKGIVRVEIVSSWDEYNNYVVLLEKQRLKRCEFSLKDVFLKGPKALPEEIKRINKFYEAVKDEVSHAQHSTDWHILNLIDKAYNSVLDVVVGPIKASGRVEKFVPDRSVMDFLWDLDSEKEVDMLDDPVKRTPFVYIIEYAFNHGLLRLPGDLRSYYNIPVMLVQLSLDDEQQCLDQYNKHPLIRYIYGYDEVLMDSVKALAENETEKGYFHDLIKNEYYHFVNYSQGKAAYITALLVMFMFTFAISMLLRFSHNQIFLFIVDLLHMFELNQPLVFPIAPLLTVILALVGMEAIMSEIFSDTTIAFYVILLVWVADQYDAIVSTSSVGRRHWLKFFFFYQYFFYVLHYRYSGQHTFAALVTASAFVVHSMVYFFHHYELPSILFNHELRSLIQRLQQQGNELQQLGRRIEPAEGDIDLPIASVVRAVTVNPEVPLSIRNQILAEARRAGMTLLDSDNTETNVSAESVPPESSQAPEPEYASDEVNSAEQTAAAVVEQAWSEVFDHPESLTAESTSTAGD